MEAQFYQGLAIGIGLATLIATVTVVVRRAAKRLGLRRGGVMELHTVSISKSQLAALSENEQALLVQLGTLHNELHMLLKFLLMADSVAARQPDGPVKTGAAAQSWLFMTLLALKICEGKKSLLDQSYHGTKLSKYYSGELTSEGQHALKEVNRYFDRGDNRISRIRDEITAHYSHDTVKEQISKFPADHASECIICEDMRGNCLFGLSRDVMLFAGLGWDGSLKDRKEEFVEEVKGLYKEIIKVAFWLVDFLHDCLRLLVEKMDLDQLEEVEIPNPPSLDESVLPYFWPPKGQWHNKT